jgi:hypothetical protein
VTSYCRQTNAFLLAVQPRLLEWVLYLQVGGNLLPTSHFSFQISQSSKGIKVVVYQKDGMLKLMTSMLQSMRSNLEL